MALLTFLNAILVTNNLLYGRADAHKTSKSLRKCKISEAIIKGHYMSSGRNERSNRTIQKTGVRTKYHRMLYPIIPRMKKTTRAAELKWFPCVAKSPNTIARTRCKSSEVAFDSYVKGSNDTNTMAPRMVGAIYKRPTQYQRRGHEVMDLNTGKVLRVLNVVLIPVTEDVIC